MDAKSKENRLCRLFCLSGVISAVFYLLHDIIGAAYYPGYDRMSQAVSDLTATDAPSYTVAGGLSGVHGIMSCVCCLFACVLVQERGRALKLGTYLFTAMSLVSAIGYSLFPLSSSGYDGSTRSFIHVYIITALVVLLSIVSLVLISVGALKEKKRFLGIAAIIALALMFAGAVGSGAAPREFFGIFERLSTYSAALFTAVLGICGFAGAFED